MAEILDLSARRYHKVRTRALRRGRRINGPVERYKRAHLNWQLNPTPGTERERLEALLAVLEAREGPG